MWQRESHFTTPFEFLPGADRFWGGKRRLLRRAPGSCPNRNRTYVHILYRKRGDLSREIREIVGNGQFFLGKSGRVSYFTTPLGAGEYVWSGMWRYGVEGDEVWCGEVVWREEICTSDRHASEKIFSCACLHMKMGFLYRPPSETLAISQLAFSRPICPLKENFELRGFFWDIAM